MELAEGAAHDQGQDETGGSQQRARQGVEFSTLPARLVKQQLQQAKRQRKWRHCQQHPPLDRYPPQPDLIGVNRLRMDRGGHGAAGWCHGWGAWLPEISLAGRGDGGCWVSFGAVAG